ncbi:MAG TPA: ABC transporter permease [Longimicrobiales bacterium]|nr:ABC transporter permease [Longimicrobiales bacterium]
MSGGGRAPRAYRAAVRLLPRGLRERHGKELESAFVEALEGAESESGRAGLVRVWAWGLSDVVRRAVYERVRGEGGRLGARVRDLGPDLRFGVRGFARRPGITLMSVLMLSLGVAAVTAVFTLVDTLFLRPLPFPSAERLVYLNETAPRWNLETTGINYADFAVWREGTRAFEAMGLFDVGSANIATGAGDGERGVERVTGAFVTHGLADALGIRPVEGRTFTRAEDAPGGERVVLLGHGLRRRLFGGRGDVIGSTLRVDGEDRTVVGVLPAAASLLGEAEVWLPMARDPSDRTGGYSFEGVGRLREGVTLEAAREDLFRAHLPIWEEHDEERVVSPRVERLRDVMVADFRGITLALAVAVGLVLLIACGNVASILLARSHARRRELGVRVALGARSGRIARQLLAESLALALVAGPLGLLLGFWLVGILAATLPEDLPAWLELAPTWRVGLFGLALILATTVLFGWAPVLQARRQDVREALTEGGGRAGASRGQRRTMSVLVVAEVTLAALLLVGGGLLVRAFQRLEQEDPGFRTENVAMFRLALPEATYPDSAATAGFFGELLGRLEAVPGVRGAGLVTCPPLGCHWGSFFLAEGQPEPGPDETTPVVLYRLVTPGYFTAMGIRLLDGRFLEDGSPEPTVVANEIFARAYFGEEDAVGRRIRFRGSHADEEPTWFRVVGVVRDVRHYGLDEPMRPGLYMPYWPRPARSMAVAVWTAVEPTALIPAARAVVGDLDPELPLYDVGTTAGVLRRSMAVRRAYSWTMAVFAGLALVLAIGGIYGVLSYAVGQRGREIGIRVALGASRAGIARLVLRQGLALAGAGLILGFLAALVAGRAMASLLVEFPATDPLTFAGVAVVLVVTALGASLVPARRALRVEPQAALREE